MNRLIAFITFIFSLSASAQVWKTLPKGVRILGYRNVTTSKVTKNYDRFRSETPLGKEITIDAKTLNEAIGGGLETALPKEVFNELMVGQYAVDASAQFNVQGMGFGYGLTKKVMFYAEIAYYKAQVNANLKRTKGNNYEKSAQLCEESSSGSFDTTICANLRQLIDIDEKSVQSFVTSQYGYQPLGKWEGAGYGDMETGLMINVLDKGYTGILFYPGVILPTGRVDDPDIIQDVGFGDGQYDLFSEIGTGYVFNDYISFGTTFRYTYQAPGSVDLRLDSEQNQKGSFDVKYGDKISLMVNSTISFNDWLSITPIYRYMRQQATTYDSPYVNDNAALATNSDRFEHQAQLTTTISSIQPFLKKKFILPAQINFNLVQTMDGKNVPKVGRFELELRMLF